MSPRTPNPSVASAVVGSVRDQAPIDATVAVQQDQQQPLSRTGIIPPTSTTVHPLLQVASLPPHSPSTTAATATAIAAATPTTIPRLTAVSESPCVSRSSQPASASSATVASRACNAQAHSHSRSHSSSTMIFSDIYKSPRSPIAKLRHHSVSMPTPLSTSTPDWCDDDHADLLSKDKVKQKDAVKRYLEVKVKNDWEFLWPSRVVDPPLVNGCVVVADATSEPYEGANQPPASPGANEPPIPIQDEMRDDDGYQVDDVESSDDDDDNSDAESTYSTVSEDLVHYRPRMEWTSDLSDDDEPMPSRSPFRFDSPNTVGSAVQATVLAKRAKRRRAVRKEMEWNEGLACFEARRNAWTGARTVRIRSKPVSPPAVSPRSPRRFFFRRSMSGSPPSSSTASTQPPQTSDGSDGSSLARSDDLRKQQSKDTTPSTTPSSRNYPVEVLLPLAPPLLPPNNALRASITPSVYLSLYDKVIIHSLQPSCPINLSDMLRACVSGWKRDGEWPPRPTMAPPAPIVKKKKPKKPTTPPQEKDGSSNMARRMSFGLLGRDKDDVSGSGAGKGIRRSLVRALGIGAPDNTPAERPTAT
ncbi:hypothetical protein CDV36_008599 [Fusarium kuroshium]|uniref:Gag1-like clamp domain-containing protein n=2 Tax=Fusarium solani species complex TaxID=232080 RepID=A0A3M2S2J4_9HYPO|nr:hypothetical protein CDV36_008599 [Fusarium kuroshium]RSL99687.1 hypothetical protein CEP52_009616 [Fusarium oligoseptatum]